MEMLEPGLCSRGRWRWRKGAPGTQTSILRGPGVPRRPAHSTCPLTQPCGGCGPTMALSPTGPPCSLTTAKSSVAAKSAEPRNRAYPGKQGSGCQARRVGHLGMQRSSSTPHPAGLEFRIRPRVLLNAGLSQRTWRRQWTPNQYRELSGPLPLLSPSAGSSWVFPGTEVQPVLG